LRVGAFAPLLPEKTDDGGGGGGLAATGLPSGFPLTPVPDRP